MAFCILSLIFLLLCLSSHITPYPLDLLDLIASKIEENISKPKLRLDYYIPLDGFVVILYDVLPIPNFNRRRVSNDTSNGDMITYLNYHISYSFKMKITQKTKYTTTSIIRPFSADEDFEEFSLKRKDDNGFTYEMRPDKKSFFFFGQSDLYDYKFVSRLFEKQDTVIHYLHIALRNYYDIVLAHFPPSYAVYYFDQFINNMIKGWTFIFPDIPHSQHSAVKFKGIAYKKITRLNVNTAIFNKLSFELEVYKNKQWFRVSLTAKGIQFGQTKVAPITVDGSYYPKEISMLINRSFQREFDKYEYDEKYQDPMETMQELMVGHD